MPNLRIRQQESEAWGMFGRFVATVLGISGAIAIGVVGFSASQSSVPPKALDALESYNGAVELCGVDNVQKHEYTNGSTDFDCRDYAAVEPSEQQSIMPDPAPIPDDLRFFLPGQDLIPNPQPEAEPVDPVLPTPQPNVRAPAVGIAPKTEPTVEPKTQIISMKSITIISPIRGKGLDRTYLSRNEIKDEANYIELGLVVRDDAGEPVNNVSVVITATDDSQNKTLASTGNVTPIYEDGVKIKTSYYPFRYEFKTIGVHTITFVAEGLTEKVELDVAEDERPN